MASHTLKYLFLGLGKVLQILTLNGSKFHNKKINSLQQEVSLLNDGVQVKSFLLLQGIFYCSTSVHH